MLLRNGIKRLERLARWPWLRRAAVAEIARAWPGLGAGLNEERWRLLECWRSELAAAAFDLSFAASPEDRLASARLIGDLGERWGAEPGLLALLGGLLRDASAEVRGGAAEACTGLIVAATGRRSTLDAHALGGLCGQVLEAFDVHRHEGALAAVLTALAAPGAVDVRDQRTLAAVLGDPAHPTMLAARSVIRRTLGGSESAGVRARLWKFASLRPALGDGTELVALAGHGHLALHPDRDGTAADRRVRTARCAAGWIGDAWTLAGGAVSAGVLQGKPESRLGAVLAIREQRAGGGVDGPSDEAWACLTDLCFDSDRAIARAATLTLVSDRGELMKRKAEATLALLARSPHASVRGAARESMAGSADGVGIGDARSRLRLQRRLRRDREGVVSELGGMLAAGARVTDDGVPASPGPQPVEPFVDPIIARAATALAACVRVDLLADVEEHVRALAERSWPANSGAARLRSMAVVALGGWRAQSVAGCATLLRCARAADPRTRASAVESLARRAMRGDGAAAAGFRAGMGAWLTDAHHRVRSTAAVWAWRLSGDSWCREAESRRGGAAGVLAGLLDEPSPAARRAGIWGTVRIAGDDGVGTGSGGLGSADTVVVVLNDRIERMAAGDVDAQVRGAAERARVEIAERLRARWGTRTADLAV